MKGTSQINPYLPEIPRIHPGSSGNEDAWENIKNFFGR
jgi:hypothetical protein